MGRTSKNNKILRTVINDLFVLDRFYQFHVFSACLLCLYLRHNFWCMISDSDLSTHVCLSMHATRHSSCHLLGTFWLSWICMFRYWSLDWSGVLRRRSSLPLIAGWLVPAPSIPDSSYQLAGFPQLVSIFCTIYIVNLTFVPSSNVMYL